MQIIVNRNGLYKNFIAPGQLHIDEKDHSSFLTYDENGIKVSANGLYHLIVALENLRRQLAVDFNSTLAIKGCRIDTSYQATGGYGTYIIQHGKQATNSVSLFDRTTDVDKLCSIDIHKTAYKTWLNSLGFDMDEDDYLASVPGCTINNSLPAQITVR